MLHNPTVCRALAKEFGELRAVTADAKATDLALSGSVAEELEESVVREVNGLGFVKQKDVDEVSAEGAQAIFERRVCVVGTEA
jgi:hypothetical protein